jgi:trimethylamine--corrinoid protein Co-methyltransferase
MDPGGALICLEVDDMNRLRLLSKNDIDLIHSQSIEILEKIGVGVRSEKASKLLVNSGAEINEARGTVRIPAVLVEEAVRNAPKDITLHGRNPKNDIRLESGLVHFGLGMNTQQVLDLETGERRHSTKEDVGRMAKLADALSNIDFVMPLCSALDKPKIAQDRHELDALLNNTEKPIMCWAEDGRALLRIAAAAAGDHEILRKQPIVSMCANTASPLQHDRKYVENLLEFAQAGVPAVYGPCIQLGATGPVTIAGSLAQANAEVLSGLVISGLAKKGAPFIYGSMGSILDQYTCVMSYGAPELALFNAGATDLAMYYGLPHFGTGGCTDSKLVDEQAVAEATETALVAGLCRTHLVHDVGYIESGMTASYEMIVINDEVAGMVGRVLADEIVSHETISLETIEKVGPGGSYLTAPHTLKYLGKQPRTRLMDRRRFDAWHKDGAKDLLFRAREKAKRLLAEHQPQPLPSDISTAIRDMIENELQY